MFLPVRDLLAGGNPDKSGNVFLLFAIVSAIVRRHLRDSL